MFDYVAVCFFKTMHVRWLNSMLLPDGLEQFVCMLLYALFFNLCNASYFFAKAQVFFYIFFIFELERL